MILKRFYSSLNLHGMYIFVNVVYVHKRFLKQYLK
jgi:hypothetical protein